MWKHVVVVAAVLAVGCGTGSEGAGDATGAGTPPASGNDGGGVGVPNLAAGTAMAKVIARRIDTVTITSPVVDGDGNPVLNPDGTPQTQTSTVSTEVFRYVTNVAAPATTVMIPEGSHYTIDVIAGGPVATVGTGTAARNVRTVLEQWRATDVTVGPGSGFSFSPVTAPATTFSPIYVGLGAPYNTFTVTAGLSFPFNGTWAISCGGTPGTVAGNRATIAAPATNPAGGTIACDASFHVASSLMVTGEAVDWSWPVALTATPVPSTMVTLP
jgi:hypothetical protein